MFASRTIPRRRPWGAGYGTIPRHRRRRGKHADECMAHRPAPPVRTMRPAIADAGFGPADIGAVYASANVRLPSTV